MGIAILVVLVRIGLIYLFVKAAILVIQTLKEQKRQTEEKEYEKWVAKNVNRELDQIQREMNQHAAKEDAPVKDNIIEFKKP